MGKGDKRSKRGKIAHGTNGKRRKKKPRTKFRPRGTSGEK